MDATDLQKKLTNMVKTAKDEQTRWKEERFLAQPASFLSCRDGTTRYQNNGVGPITSVIFVVSHMSQCCEHVVYQGRFSNTEWVIQASSRWSRVTCHVGVDTTFLNPNFSVRTFYADALFLVHWRVHASHAEVADRCCELLKVYDSQNGALVEERNDGDGL